MKKLLRIGLIALETIRIFVRATCCAFIAAITMGSVSGICLFGVAFGIIAGVELFSTLLSQLRQNDWDINAL